MLVRVLIVLCLLMVNASGCSTLSPKEKLHDVVLHFNDNIRWQRYREAARAIPPRRRSAWVKAMRRMGQMVRIDEVEMRPVEVNSDFAIIEVDLSYHRQDDLRVRTEKREQVWRFEDEAWHLESDREIIVEEGVLPDRFPELSGPPTPGSSHR